jgi:co-chaperonin GroES (HSP10)
MADINVEGTSEVGAKMATQLPKPAGYRLLCAVPQVEDKFESGILKPDSMVKTEEHSTVILFVLEVGPAAYADKTRFAEGPWCKKGDFVLTRAYAGTRFKIHGQEFRLINDDSVEAVVEDPRGYTRA